MPETVETLKTVFETKNYRDYLRSRDRERGFRMALARACRCQSSYISRVLSGSAHLSLEQADSINELLGHTPEETNFFLILVQLGRAGSASLKRHFQTQLDELLERRLVLKDRLKIKRTFTREDQAIYYSSWLYSACHILISIKTFQTIEAISKHLNLTSKKTKEVLEFLASIGAAVRRENGSYELGTARIHLERDSPMISKHHANWRMQALQSVERDRPEDLHYSVTVGVSDEDAARIRELAVGFIEQVLKIVHASPQERAHSLCLDLFGV